MTTPNILILTPTRGRPDRFRALVEAVETTTQGRAIVLGGVDDDDPALDEYLALDFGTTGKLAVGSRRSLSTWTNDLARSYVLEEQEAWQAPYIASLGDDHLPRTKHWDRKLIKAIEQLDGPGWAWGEDKYAGSNLPTSWVVSTEIVRALGWVMLPTCKHMYVDNAVLDLGHATNRIAYVPQVIIEHLHPAAGKATWDASYQETNSSRSYAEDRAAYRRWRAGQIRRDMATVQGVGW